jgi:membrane protein DedA with SNARE-associated domain/membrane-associated phospholipid phosphatase
LLQQLLIWIGAHPHWAGLIVFAIACTEALAFVGMVVPGATMMVGAGALVGLGAMEFWSTLAWAVAGAIAGDGVSYWLGHRYKDALRSLRPLRERPALLERGEVFFERHGGKSVLLARFVGPVRPIVPVVAGMLGMPPARFYFYNSLSALAWAPAHLLPGMAFGLSLALAGEVAGRLALLLGALVLFVWATLWLAHALYRGLQPHASNWAERALGWTRRHRALAWLVGDVLDPERPLPRGLLAWVLVLLAGGWLFVGVLEDVVSADPIVYAGKSLQQLLQHLRTPIGDRLMIAVTELGDTTVALAVIAAVLAWLLWRRAWRDARYWLAAVAFGELVVATIKAALHVPRPEGFAAVATSYSFPSGHASMSTVIYGFLAVLVAPALRAGWRWLPYAAAALLVCAIAFSRLYLGAHWLADVLAGVGLGTAWVAILAIARQRHEGSHPRVPGLAAVAGLAFVAAASWHIASGHARDLQRYAVRHAAREMPVAGWREDGWRSLPQFRRDLEGEREQPINVQAAGDLPRLRQELVAAGWRAPPALTLQSALRWLLRNPSLDELPVLPQLNGGRYEALLLVRDAPAGADPSQQLVLRLWPTMVRLEPGATRLWVGTVATQRLRRLPLVSFPVLADHFDEAAAALARSAGGLHTREVQSEPQAHEPECLRCGVLLLIENQDAGPRLRSHAVPRLAFATCST